jgi:hypothetical protein
MSFEQVASIYDATRGGERRGNGFAGAMAPWVAGPRAVELGIGTGVIANGLRLQNIDGLAPLRAQRLGHNQILATDLPGLSLVHQGFTPWDGFPSTVTDEIDHIENRIYSSLFDVDDATWTTVVEPVLGQLRALPDPDRPRDRRNRHPLLVWDVRHQ